MTERRAEALKLILDRAGSDPEARSVLEAYYGVTGYDRLEGPAQQQLDAARRLVTRAEMIKETPANR